MLYIELYRCWFLSWDMDIDTGMLSSFQVNVFITGVIFPETGWSVSQTSLQGSGIFVGRQWYLCLLGCVHIPICFQRSFHHDCFVSGIHPRLVVWRICNHQLPTFPMKRLLQMNSGPSHLPSINHRQLGQAPRVFVTHWTKTSGMNSIGCNICNHWRLSSLARKLFHAEAFSKLKELNFREHKSRVPTLLRCSEVLSAWWPNGDRPSCDAHRDANSSSSSAHPLAAPASVVSRRKRTTPRIGKRNTSPRRQRDSVI